MKKQETSIYNEFCGNIKDRLFDENEMYDYIESYAKTKNMHQTLKALPFARAMHEGQFRKGKEKIPYIYHPLLVACHALALGLDDDHMVSAALLHDVCEDCGIKAEELPVGKDAKEAVALLTKDKGDSFDEKRYYQRISENPIALMVKLLDRCNNVSGMAAGFTKEKLIQYIRETEKFFYPMMEKAKRKYPRYSNQLFLIQYHMKSVIQTIRHLG